LGVGDGNGEDKSGGNKNNNMKEKIIKEKKKKPKQMQVFLPFLSTLECEGTGGVIFTDEDLATLAKVRQGLKISIKPQSSWERNTKD